MVDNGFIIHLPNRYPLQLQEIRESVGNSLGANYFLKGKGDIGQKGVEWCVGLSWTPRDGGKKPGGIPGSKI